MRACLLVFSSLIALGQLVLTLGIWLKSWPVMYLGTIIVSLGGENFNVANCALLANWFRGGELAFAFGVSLSMAKLGSVLNDVTSPVLVE